ncbi:MAG: DUF362 domain-containing protein [Candidatus Hodarchaeota archaeon]
MKNYNCSSISFSSFINKTLNKERLKKNLLFITLINFIWLSLRTGSKPSRIIYPCQQAAVGNLSITMSTIIPHSILTSFFTIKTYLSKNRATFLLILIIGVFMGGLFLRPQVDNVSQEILLNFESKEATSFPASDIYVVSGLNEAHFSKLINLMISHDLFFYQSNSDGENKSINGLIAQNDVVLLKINSQWPTRGGTNTDLLKEVIQAIIGHPDGFNGEIIVADNGQGRGHMDFGYSNAENTSQSTQDVVDSISSTYSQVSTYDWQGIRSKSVDEYSEGDISDGYIVYDTPDPETGIYVSYPKFETQFGTQISFKNGIWNGTGYEKRLKVINMPVLKSHVIYGVTASSKNYMGVQSEILAGGLANGHECVATGGMGTLMAECGLPTLNIIDAIWVNANPYPSSSTGPSTNYDEATRVNTLVAGVDPIALDYWAANHILIETAKLIGYDNTQSLDPDNNERGGLGEAFGVWLNLSKEELLRADYNVTSNENSLNVFVYEAQVPSSTSLPRNTTSPNQTSSFSIVLLVLSLIIIVSLQQQRKNA